MVLESVNLDDYDNDDFIEVFFRFFRPWVKQKHGDEISEYPMSYLFKKYIDEVAWYGLEQEYFINICNDNRK